MNSFKKLIDFISFQGLDTNLLQSETKRIILTNRLSVICVFFTLPYVIGFFYFGYTFVSILLGAFCLAYLLPLLINFFRLYVLAKLTLFCLILTHHFILASIFGKRADIQVIYIALILVPIVFFDFKKQSAWIFFCVLITIAATLTLYATNFSLLLIPDLSETTLSKLNASFKITTILGAVAILLSTIMVSDKAEKVQDENNLFLQNQFKAIFDNSLDALFLVNAADRRITRANIRAVELFEMEKESDFFSKLGIDFHKGGMPKEKQAQMQEDLLARNIFEDEVLYETNKKNEFWGALVVRLISINGKTYHSVRVTDITEQKKVRQNIAISLQEKEVLLAEIHHRVKNNLAVISGLLSVQAGYVEDEKAKKLFEESRNRIHSMALIHDKLYNYESLSKIEFRNYINDLVDHIENSHKLANTKVKFSVSCSDIFLDIKNAIPCGLILNELISNSYKHAFIGRSEGEIKIVCSIMAEKFTMSVSDDGVGFDEIKLQKNPKTLGLTLIDALVDQLGGKINISNKNGTSYFISYEVG